MNKDFYPPPAKRSFGSGNPRGATEYENSRRRSGGSSREYERKQPQISMRDLESSELRTPSMRDLEIPPPPRTNRETGLLREMEAPMFGYKNPSTRYPKDFEDDYPRRQDDILPRDFKSSSLRHYEDTLRQPQRDDYSQIVPRDAQDFGMRRDELADSPNYRNNRTPESRGRADASKSRHEYQSRDSRNRGDMGKMFQDEYLMREEPSSKQPSNFADCIVVYIERTLRPYSEIVKDSLAGVGISVSLEYVARTESLRGTLDGLSRRGAKYVVIVDEKNEEMKHATVHILKGTPLGEVQCALIDLAHWFKMHEQYNEVAHRDEFRGKPDIPIPGGKPRRRGEPASIYDDKPPSNSDVYNVATHSLLPTPEAFGRGTQRNPPAKAYHR